MRRALSIWTTAAVLAVLVFLPGAAAARPNYFATFTSTYGLIPGDDLYACGVCHRRWEGTGARNPFGVEVEQQLYVGKTIAQAIHDVENFDTDGDGFTNIDEVTIYGTLPGYSCDTYTLVFNPPPNFQTLITPGVPSCLLPKDIEVSPANASYLTEIGKTETVAVHVVNNGNVDPITVSAFELVAGTDAAFSIVGPALPIVVGVGETADLDVSFSPTVPTLANGTVRVTSDDPDEPVIDIPISGIGFAKNLAPAPERAACFAQAERRFEAYSRTHLAQWAKCYVDELRGVACDAGRRDQKIAAAAANFRAFLGGAKDKKCAGNGLTRARMDLPAACPAPCGSVAINSIAGWANCLICQQDAATQTMLDVAVGTSAPDLPLNQLTGKPLRCNKSLITGERAAIGKIQKKLAACRLANVTAVAPVDCDATVAADIAVQTAKVNGLLALCADSTGLLGCRFTPMPDPQCLGNAASGVASDLVGSVFDTAD